ncbi:DUF2267 domain-containing protein [Dactylosporangium sp. CA-139066]|uniref:DUF2267 domain-containing protein n=1 Tax=Dactylosporangium sp. CA-139066 TaxID=3239930 RepID=UPI003D949531
MDHETFIGIVARHGGLDPRQAQRSADAVLETLAMRIGRGHAEELRDSVPAELAPALERGVVLGRGRAHRMSVEAFLDEIAQREDDATREEAAARARAVFAALRAAGGDEAFRATAEQLPKDYAPLLDAAPDGPVLGGGPAPGGTVPAPRAAQPAAAGGAAPGPLEPPREYAGPLTAGEFAGLVAERAHLERDRAAVATEAVLEALALRMPEARIEELRAYVPPPLHPPLLRGVERGRGGTARTDLADLLDEVAVREGPEATGDDAAAHTRAVLSVLRDVTAPDEFRDCVAELPAGYEPVVPRLTAPGPRIR